jgi:hypothetical protein
VITLHRKLPVIALIALMASVVIGVGWPLASIQLRLSRNGKIAHQLVESLEAKFQGKNFRGAASYEREVIYIRVGNGLDDADREDVERWLRVQQIEQQIAPEIRLRFEKDDPDKEVIIRPLFLSGRASGLSWPRSPFWSSDVHQACKRPQQHRLRIRLYVWRVGHHRFTRLSFSAEVRGTVSDRWQCYMHRV